MEAAKYNWFLLFFFALATIIPTPNANIAHFDEVWEKRAEEAKIAALEVYNPNPENATDEFHKHVHRALEEYMNDMNLEDVTLRRSLQSSNSTRRQLRKKYKGPCKATNPIDRCWRCQKNWARNRKKLADCVIGFGHKTTGGKKGPIYVVTDSSDNDMVNPKPGTLRHAVIQKQPLWIIFKRSMTIRLAEELIMQGDKTIDGRGVNVHIAKGAGITMQFVKNIIIHNIHIHNIGTSGGGMIRDSIDHVGLRTYNEGDGISIFGASNIWIDHVSMKKCSDGLIDAIEGSTAITISNSHFTDHDKAMLFGAHNTDSMDKIMQITIAFNHYGKRLVQRMPACRWGFFHVVNNDYTHWEKYAIGGTGHPTIISQGNRFIAPDDINLKQITHRDAAESEWRQWTWRSEGDKMMNGAFFVPSGNPSGSKSFGNLGMIKAYSVKYVNKLTRFAGTLGCRPGKRC